MRDHEEGPGQAHEPKLAKDFRSARAAWWGLPGLVCLAVAVYGQTLLFDLVKDDHPLYVTNPTIHGLVGWKEILSSPTSAFLPHIVGADRMYRPLQALTVIADRAVWRTHPGGFHLTSLLVHLAVVILVWRIGEKITQDRVAAYIAGAILAVHPSAVEAVAFLSARMDLFVALGMAATVLLLRGCLGRWGTWRLLGALLAFAFALLSKETALAIPPLVTWAAWVYPAWFAEADPHPRRSALAARVIPFWVVLGFYAVLRYAVVGSFSPQPIRLVDLPVQMLRALVAAAYYGEMTLFPWPTGRFIMLGMIRPPTSLADARVLLGLVLVGLLAGTLLWLRRGYPAEAFTLGWYLAALVPTSNILPIYGEHAVYVAERSLYPALVGWCLFLAVGSQRLRAAAGGALLRSRALLRIMGGALLGTFLVVTALKVTAWRDDVTLWTAAFVSDPTNPTIRKALAAALTAAGDLEGAQAALQKAAAESPKDPDVASQSGWVAEVRGDLAGALSQYERSIALGTNEQEVFRRAAMTAARLKEWDRAARWFAVAAQRFPQTAWPQVGLGWYHGRAGRNELASEYFDRAARLEPTSPQPRWFLAELLAAEGRTSEAVREYRAALALDPTFVPAHRELALLSERAGRISEAIAYWRHMAAIVPGTYRAEPLEHLRRLEALAPRVPPAGETK